MTPPKKDSSDRRSEPSPSVVRLQEQLSATIKDVENLKKTVYGNGNEGLKAQTSTLWTKEAARAVWDNRVWVILSLIFLKISLEIIFKHLT